MLVYICNFYKNLQNVSRNVSKNVSKNVNKIKTMLYDIIKKCQSVRTKVEIKDCEDACKNSVSRAKL